MYGISEIKLRKCVIKKGLNVGELATLSGISASRITELLTKGGYSRAKTVHKLAKALDCSPEEFLVLFLR